MREYAKKATTYTEEVQRHVNRVVGAVELFAALMHQRMDPYKGVLTPEFKQFCKERRRGIPCPTGQSAPSSRISWRTRTALRPSSRPGSLLIYLRGEDSENL